MERITETTPVVLVKCFKPSNPFICCKMISVAVPPMNPVIVECDKKSTNIPSLHWYHHLQMNFVRINWNDEWINSFTWTLPEQPETSRRKRWPWKLSSRTPLYYPDLLFAEWPLLSSRSLPPLFPPPHALSSPTQRTPEAAQNSNTVRWSEGFGRGWRN